MRWCALLLSSTTVLLACDVADVIVGKACLSSAECVCPTGETCAPAFAGYYCETEEAFVCLPEPRLVPPPIDQAPLVLESPLILRSGQSASITLNAVDPDPDRVHEVAGLSQIGFEFPGGGQTFNTAIGDAVLSGVGELTFSAVSSLAEVESTSVLVTVFERPTPDQVSHTAADGERAPSSTMRVPVIVIPEGGIVEWTGVVDARWSNADNWQPARVPGTADRVYVGVSDNDPFELSERVTVDELFVVDGASVFVDEVSVEGARLYAGGLVSDRARVVGPQLQNVLGNFVDLELDGAELVGPIDADDVTVGPLGLDLEGFTARADDVLVEGPLNVNEGRLVVTSSLELRGDVAGPGVLELLGAELIFSERAAPLERTTVRASGTQTSTLRGSRFHIAEVASAATLTLPARASGDELIVSGTVRAALGGEGVFVDYLEIRPTFTAAPESGLIFARLCAPANFDDADYIRCGEIGPGPVDGGVVDGGVVDGGVVDGGVVDAGRLDAGVDAGAAFDAGVDAGDGVLDGGFDPDGGVGGGPGDRPSPCRGQSPYHGPLVRSLLAYTDGEDATGFLEAPAGVSIPVQEIDVSGVGTLSIDATGQYTFVQPANGTRSFQIAIDTTRGGQLGHSCVDAVRLDDLGVITNPPEGGGFTSAPQSFTPELGQQSVLVIPTGRAVTVDNTPDIEVIALESSNDLLFLGGTLLVQTALTGDEFLAGASLSINATMGGSFISAPDFQGFGLESSVVFFDSMLFSLPVDLQTYRVTSRGGPGGPSFLSFDQINGVGAVIDAEGGLDIAEALGVVDVIAQSDVTVTGGILGTLELKGSHTVIVPDATALIAGPCQRAFFPEPMFVDGVCDLNCLIELSPSPVLAELLCEDVIIRSDFDTNAAERISYSGTCQTVGQTSFQCTQLTQRP